MSVLLVAAFWAVFGGLVGFEIADRRAFRREMRRHRERMEARRG